MPYLQDIDNIFANSRRRKNHHCYHQSHSCRCHHCCCHRHHHHYHRYIITSIDGTINTRQANNHAIKDIATSWKCKSLFALDRFSIPRLIVIHDVRWTLLKYDQQRSFIGYFYFKQMPLKYFIGKCGCLNILNFTEKEAVNGGINRETHSKVSRHKIL